MTNYPEEERPRCQYPQGRHPAEQNRRFEEQRRRESEFFAE
jgi:hypothetical protein